MEGGLADVGRVAEAAAAWSPRPPRLGRQPMTAGHGRRLQPGPPQLHRYARVHELVYEYWYAVAVDRGESAVSCRLSFLRTRCCFRPPRFNQSIRSPVC